MTNCHKCSKELKQGFTTLTFQENGLVIQVSHIPAMVCECTESRIKAPVAEYVSDLVDEVLTFHQAQQHKTKRWIPVREITLDLAA